MIRVLMVDDEPRLLQAWTQLLAGESEVKLVGTRSLADGLAAVVDELSPQVVVIDLTMPGSDPLDVVRQLSSSHPDVRAVAHSANNDPLLVQEAFDAGAWAFVDKVAAGTDLVDVIRRVARGEVVFPSGVDVQTGQ